MDLFYQLVYEYQKELRDLILYTCDKRKSEDLIGKLRRQNINYTTYPVDEKKVNLFFGAKECLNIISHFSSRDLSKLTPHEDFILGIMLGYGKAQQYERFLTRIKRCA